LSDILASLLRPKRLALKRILGAPARGLPHHEIGRGRGTTKNPRRLPYRRDIKA